MPFRQLIFAAALGAIIITNAREGLAQNRAINLQPASRAREASSAINQALGLSRSQMSLLAVEHRTPAALEAQVLLDGHPQTLQLQPHSVRAPNYQLLVQQPDGSLAPAPPNPIRTFRGTVAGVPDSAVAATLDDRGLRAVVLIPGKPRMWIEPAPSSITAAAGTHVIYTDADRLAPAPACGTFAPPAAGFESADTVFHAPANVAASAFGENDTRWTQLAVDSDVEFYNFHGSAAAAEAEIHEIFNIVNVQYHRDVGISYYIVALVLRPSEPDPYGGTQPSNSLDQFRDEWFRFHSGIERDVAHMFTGRSLANNIAGIAYFSGICETLDGYSLVSRVVPTCGLLACRTDLTAHELGHNWSAPHCACPSTTMNTTLQSANQFHPTSSVTIMNYRDTRACLEIGDTLLGVEVAAPAVAIAENNQVPMTAFAEFEFNYDQDVTDSVIWSVDPPSLGTITADGLFTSSEVSGSLSGAINATYTFDSVTQVGSLGITVSDAQAAPLPDPSLPDKVRYISVSPPAAGPSVALQVRIVSLYTPNPPDASGGPDFSGWEGYTYWIGPVQSCPDLSSSGTFGCAKLQCEPHYATDWGSQIIHVTAPEIIPSSVYEIRSYPLSCQGEEEVCGLGSAILTVRTQRWGDIAAPFQIPGAGGQPSALDVAAMVDKVRALQGSIAMPRAQLQPADVEPASNASALDIAMVVDAVKGAAYPFDGPCACPPFFTCPFADPCGRCREP